MERGRMATNEVTLAPSLRLGSALTLALSSLLEDVFGLDLALPARDQALADVVAALREILVILALASNAVLNVLLLRPCEEVGRIAARWVITFVEHGQALRDGSDPQLIVEPVYAGDFGR
jgi:hypothetical protein